MCNGEEATTQEIRKREFKHFVVQDLFLLSLLISTTGNYKIHTHSQVICEQSVCHYVAASCGSMLALPL